MATPSKRSNRTLLFWTASAILLVVVFIVARRATRITVTVRAFTVERGPLRSDISTNGKIEPQVNWEAHAPFPGVIKSLFTQEGDRVPQGKLLLAINDADALTRRSRAAAALDGARASSGDYAAGGSQEERLTLSGDVERARQERDQAAASLATLKKLAATGAAAPSEVTAAESRLSSDEAALHTLQQRQTGRYDAADLTHARASVAEAQAAVAAARQAIANANVRAPFAGTVYSLNVARTDYVQQGDLLLQLADLSKMQVRAYFDEPEIGKLSVGQPIIIHWDAKPDRVWHGHISRVPSTIITYTTRNVGQVLCTIDDANGELLPSTNVTVTVTTADIPHALYVPREALHTEQGRSYVYAIVKGSIRRTPVTVGNLNLTQVQLLSGLDEGDTVALGAANGLPLTSGLPVTVAR
jgi:HlyD family secretion protein